MSAKSDKGKKWALIVFVVLLVPLAMRILFASGHTDPQERVIAGLAGFIGREKGTDLFSVRDRPIPKQKMRPVKPFNSHVKYKFPHAGIEGKCKC